MKFSVVVLAPPYSSQAAFTALRFCQAALAQGHEVFRVFFYQDGIHTSSAISCPPQDEYDIYQAWQALQTEYQLDCVTCIAAAARRGMLSEEEAKRHKKTGANMATEFELSGLGQLVEANARSDRILTFGH